MVTVKTRPWFPKTPFYGKSQIGGKPFRLEHMPEEALRAQFEGATDSMQKSFAALMLGYSSGDAINMTSTQQEFGIKLTSIDQFARIVLGQTATH
jgi:hypothetical protein